MQKNMSDQKLMLEEIRNHWVKAGNQYSNTGGVTPTSRDPYLGQLEEVYIQRYLRKSHAVLEIGCGSGFHTIKYSKSVAKITGIDFVDNLIDFAKKRADFECIENADFVSGSVFEIDKIFRNEKFNCVVSQRCLINLCDWQHQKEVILKVHSLLPTKGTFLLTEGFHGELNNLNNVRKKCGLSEIKVVNYNKNLVRKEFERFIGQYFDVMAVHHYGAYLFLSRIIHPLIVSPKEPKHDSRLNDVAKKISRIIQLPYFKKYSYNLFYFLRKK